MRLLVAALFLSLAPASVPQFTERPAYVPGYRKAPLVTLGVPASVALDSVALRQAAEAACADVRPCAARIWVGRGQRFRTMSTAEVRSLVASYAIAADGRGRFVCGPTGLATTTCSVLGARVGTIAERPAI